MHFQGEHVARKWRARMKFSSLSLNGGWNSEMVPEIEKRVEEAGNASQSRVNAANGSSSFISFDGKPRDLECVRLIPIPFSPSIVTWLPSHPATATTQFDRSNPLHSHVERPAERHRAAATWRGRALTTWSWNAGARPGSSLRGTGTRWRCACASPRAAAAAAAWPRSSSPPATTWPSPASSPSPVSIRSPSPLPIHARSNLPWRWHAHSLVRGAAKVKGPKTKAFLRVLKYSHGGVLEVRDLPRAFFSFWLFFFHRLVVWPEWKIIVKMDYSDCPCMYQPAKMYKIKHLHKIEVAQNDPSGCTFILVCHFPFSRINTRRSMDPEYLTVAQISILELSRTGWN